MNVRSLPVTPARQREIRVALEASDKALEELLRQAVLAVTAGGMRTVGSISRNHHDGLCRAYLHAAEILLDYPGLADTLAEAVSDGVLDLPALTALARQGSPVDPDAA